MKVGRFNKFRTKHGNGRSNLAKRAMLHLYVADPRNKQQQETNGNCDFSLENVLTRFITFILAPAWDWTQRPRNGAERG